MKWYSTKKYKPDDQEIVLCRVEFKGKLYGYSLGAYSYKDITGRVTEYWYLMDINGNESEPTVPDEYEQYDITHWCSLYEVEKTIELEE